MKQRLDFVLLATLSGAPPIAELCRRFRISRTCAHKWLKRFRSGGEPALADLSRAPRTQPKRTKAKMERLILAERALHPANGPRKLHRRLKNKGHQNLPSPSTLARILKRNDRITPAASQAGTPFKRFQRQAPNQLWQMDFKGHFTLANGKTCHPLTILDDHSRYLITLQACPNETTPTVQQHLENVFRHHGLPEAILCDNGHPWASPNAQHTSLSVWLLRLGIRVLHGKPRHPQTQGKEERFHRTLKDELLTRADWPDHPQTQARFDAYRHDYNHHRPHAALNFDTPSQHYHPSPRPFPGQLPTPSYPSGVLTRTVRENGEINLHNRAYQIGRPFADLPIALRPIVGSPLLKATLGSLPLGLIDPNTPLKTHSPMLPLSLLKTHLNPQQKP